MMIEKPVRVGLVGFGTVGSGVARLLLDNADSIQARTGVRLELACVVDVDTASPRPVNLPDGLLTNDLHRLLNDESISIGIELVGGTTIAKDIQLAMLAAGKHVVTANKALLAEHGPALFAAARSAGKCIAFEASCAGGIPIVSVLRSGLAANHISAIYGILNGTCNYILSNMTAKHEDFQSALSQAQQKGYAEADPTLDINGSDTAHKLAILGSLAFGYEIPLDAIYVEGIEQISVDDIRCGLEMGYVIKLLAIGVKRDHKISLRVHPCFIHEDSLLAQVNGPFNAISVFGHAVGNTMYYGRGAGMMPTASAVVADIIEIALGNSPKIFSNLQLRPVAQARQAMEDIGQITSRFYMRVMAKDQPGVVATYGKILGDHGISISGALQHEGKGPYNTVPVIITTHPTLQANMTAALQELCKTNVVSGEPACIRIIDIPEDHD
ncbi:MAG: homoserine dehydrogenase [Sedimentisphaerales bacterium]|nr:homoserine dehydrogenase [Sedimentisphaerales bacterium]